MELESSSDKTLMGDRALGFLTASAQKAYEEARISGLCHEGAWEIAVRRDREDRLAGDRVAEPDAMDRSQDADH